MTTIEWTNETWNPTTGCDRISPGCDRCYALPMAKRLKGMEQARGAANPKYQTDGDPRTSGPGFGITVHPDSLTEPLRWKKPRKVFVNSMSDLFHARVPREFLVRVFAVMAATPQHTYQILTKRPERAARILTDLCRCGTGHPPGEHFRSSMEWAATSHSPTYVPGLEHGIYHRSGWPLPNVWIGTSVENQKYADLRIPALVDTPAAVRFLSCEPLLGPVRLAHQDHSGHERDYDGDFICLDCSTDEEHVPWRTVDNPALDIDWVIIGGESGPGARPFDPQWAADLITDARLVGAAPFVKQLGSAWARTNNASDAKGGKPDDWPTDLRVREYPTSPDTSGATS